MWLRSIRSHRLERPQSMLSQNRRTAALYEQPDLGAPFDPIVYTREEFERLSETRLFVAQALAEGRWLAQAAADLRYAETE